MISVQEARQLIKDAAVKREGQMLPLAEAAGLFLAEDVRSAYPLPMFTNSAMDGYAVVAGDTELASEMRPVELKVSGTIAAGGGGGMKNSSCISVGQTMRIFTGALVPEGATAVIRQEDTETRDGILVVKTPVPVGKNMRMQGEELGRGDVLLQAGTRLTAAGIGLLATAGCDRVKVIPPQKVGLVVTGSEIAELGNNLKTGEIFDSNSYTIQAALIQAGIVPVFVQHARDDMAEVVARLGDGLEASDTLLVTGGVSVGDFDFVKDAAAELGLETVLWKVRQKPGKPLFVGASPDRRKLLFGLPGNPASALVCFYEYVLPALLKSMGASDPELPRLRLPLSCDFRKNGNLVHFLKGRIQPSGCVEILEQQGSHMLSSFARANCLVVIPEETMEVLSGDSVEVHLLPV